MGKGGEVNVMVCEETMPGFTVLSGAKDFSPSSTLTLSLSVSVCLSVCLSVCPFVYMCDAAKG